MDSVPEKNSTEKRVVHFRALNEVITRLKEYDRDEMATLRIRRVDFESMQVLTLMDASFAQEPGCKSQMGFISVITDSAVMEKAASCDLVEFQRHHNRTSGWIDDGSGVGSDVGST